MDVKSYAKIAGITPERVRQLARAGRIEADIVGGRWEIAVEYEGAQRRVPTRRPLSQQSRAELLRFFVTMKLDHVKGVRKARVAERYRALMAAPSKSWLLLEWWGWEDAEGSFAERNFIRAAKLGDEDWLAAMLAYPDAWPLSNGPIVAARLGDCLLLKGIKVDELARRAKLPVSTVRGIVRYGEGYGFAAKLDLFKVAGLKYSEVYPA